MLTPESNLQNSGQAKDQNQTGLPLSTAQLGIWLMQQQNPDSPGLNQAEYLEIDGTLDPDLFSEACRQLVAEFDLYHLIFTDTPDGPRQQVRDTPAGSITIRDLRGESDPKAAAMAWMQADLGMPGEKTGKRLFTLALLQIADDCCLFYQRCHRLICDRHSFGITTTRLAEIYTGLVVGEPLPPSSQPSALELVEAEQAYRSGETFAHEHSFWMEQLAALPEPVNLTGRSTRKAIDPPDQAYTRAPAGTRYEPACAHPCAANQPHRPPHRRSGDLSSSTERCTSHTDCSAGDRPAQRPVPGPRRSRHRAADAS